MSIDTGGMTNTVTYQRFKPGTGEADGVPQSWACNRAGQWIDSMISKVLLRAYQHESGGVPPAAEMERKALLVARELKEEAFRYDLGRGIPTLAETLERARLGDELGLGILVAALNPRDLPEDMRSMYVAFWSHDSP
jgi:hypothetical protein